MYQYFPSCNFTRLYPAASKWIIQYFKKNTDVKIQGCCNKSQYVVEDVALGVCQTCREHIEAKGYIYRSIWQYIDEHDEFPLPDYSGLEVSIQDCWRDQEHPETKQAIRNILKKMNIVVYEIEKPAFCGNFHMEPSDLSVKEVLDSLPNHSWNTIPNDIKMKIFKEQASYHQNYPIITYCNRCTMALTYAGANATHLLQLIYQGQAK